MPNVLQMPLSDTDARGRALDVTRSFIVEAPAGSGKTGLLIQRFLRLLAEGGVERPEEVLAITFTRKATGEMRERMLAELHKASKYKDESNLSPFELATRKLAQAVLVREAEGDWHLLDQPQRLNIRTIDSLCHEIAGHLPVLSGLGGRMQPVDDARAHYAAAARQTLEELDSSDPLIADALHLLLLHRDGRLDDCERLIAAMLAQRDQWARVLPTGDELADSFLNGKLRPKLEAEFTCIVVAALERVRDLFTPEQLAELATLAHVAARVLASEGKEAALAPYLQMTQPPMAEAECVEHWLALSRLLLSGDAWHKSIDIRLGFAAKTAEKQRMLSLLQELKSNNQLLEALNALGKLPPARYTDEEWRLTKALFRLLRRAHAQLRIVFAASGQCDFSELSMAALEALETSNGSTELAAALGLRYRHLLVDEMQDTSISQYKLLESLTQQWDGASQTVFLVGDPRQSIYLFRQACVEQFSRAIYSNRLGDIKLEHLQLTANFRSHPSLVAAFNEHFAAIQPHHIHVEDDSPHLSAEAGRRAVNASTEARLYWHANPLPSGSSAADRADAADAEANEIVRIVQMETAGIVPSARPPVAVLVRAKNHAARIAAALRSANIPYRATEIDALGSQQEVLDTLSLLRALLHPADRVAWLSVLHAPWCGLGVRDLYIAAGGDNTALAARCVDDLITEHATEMSAEGRKRALHTQQILHAAMSQAGRLPLTLWLEGVWRSLGAPLYLKPHELQNVQAFFALLSAFEERGETIDAALLLERLEDLCAPESEAPVLVDIMTIHKAKGLEWEMVVVPALERSGASDTAQLLQYVKDVMQEDKPALFAPIPRTGVNDNNLHRYLSGLRTQAQRLELRRLFYVASTRAREKLHFFAQPVATTSKGISPHSNSLLRAAWAAAEGYFTSSTAGPVLALAAAAEPARIVRRIPSVTDIAALTEQHSPVPLHIAEAGIPLPQRAYQRVEGSLSARALGTVVHAYLDRIAQEFAAGATAASLEPVLKTWLPGIIAMLRSFGLPPAEVQRRSAQTLAALHSTMSDAQGQWVLSPHPQAASEMAMSTWASDDSLATYRMDRSFLAGATPLNEGQNFLWIVDYKISAQDESSDAAILAAEAEKHRSQLEAYARVQQLVLKDADGIRLAAFYPLRTSGGKLKVWEFSPGSER